MTIVINYQAMKPYTKKLRHYENAEEEERMVVLPCKPGTVCVIESYCSHPKDWCDQKYKGKCRRCEYLRYYINEKYFAFSDILSDFKWFGKTIFLTREKAEEEKRSLERERYYIK